MGSCSPIRCNDANPTAMPATASSSGSPAAARLPNAISSRITLGIPDSSSALCSACSLVLLKSAQTGHSPVTFAVVPFENVNPPT